MRRLFSVAPVLLWLITPLAFAQLPVSPASRHPRWTKLVAPGADAGVHHPLTFIQAILLMMTSFTRIIIVLVYCVTRLNALRAT